MVLGQQEQSDKLIEEFGRQILVPGIDEAGQLNISKKKVCIIGLGALGTVASQYLVRSGVGKIHLIDHDKIEKSNLHRQINYDLNDIGKSKSKISKHKLKSVNNIKSNLIFGFSSIKVLKFNECSLIIVVLLTLLSLCFEIFDFDFPISFRS